MEIDQTCEDGGKMLVNAKFADILRFNGITTAEKLLNIDSEGVKTKLKERGTFRTFLKMPDGSSPLEAYIKRYTHLPLKEYFKSILCFKPIFPDGAIHEWKAIVEFHGKRIPTAEPIAAARTSKGTCILCLGITDYTRASELFANFAEHDFSTKKRMIYEIASIAGKMHLANFAHQDFYLVHLFVSNRDGKIYLIDLQRTIMQDKLSVRWRIKDLAQLHFSAEKYLTRRDILRFWKKYSDTCGKAFYRNGKLMKSILAKSARIAKRAEANAKLHL